MAVIEEIEEGDVPLTKEDMARLLQVKKVLKNISSSSAFTCPEAKSYVSFLAVRRFKDGLNFRTTRSL